MVRAVQKTVVTAPLTGTNAAAAKPACSPRPAKTKPGRSDLLVQADPRLDSFRMRYSAVAGERLKAANAVWDDPVMDADSKICWFVAALSAALKADPKFADKALTDNHDGTVTVRFYQYSDHYRPVRIRIKASLPQGGWGSTEDGYVHCRDPKKAYAGLILKAYVAWKASLPAERDPDVGHSPIHPEGSGYDIVNQRWHAGYLLSELTGRPTTEVIFDPRLSATEQAKIYQQIADADKAGKAIVAVSRAQLLDDAGMHVINPSHSYTVLGVATDGDAQLPCVRLRNPDGQSEPSFREGRSLDDRALDGKADGIFNYYRGTFFDNFAGILIA